MEATAAATAQLDAAALERRGLAEKELKLEGFLKEQAGWLAELRKPRAKPRARSVVQDLSKLLANI